MACRLLTVPDLSHSDLKNADMLLLKFCNHLGQLYGKKDVRINIHLHCHLKECIEYYGLIYSFWCFAFEWHIEIIHGQGARTGFSHELVMSEIKRASAASE